MIETTVFFVLAAVLIVELVWLRAVDRRAARLADRYVDQHLAASDVAELARAQRLAFAAGVVCFLGLATFAAELVSAKGWLSEADLFLVVVFLPLSTVIVRLAKRLKEEVLSRTGVG